MSPAYPPVPLPETLPRHPPTNYHPVRRSRNPLGCLARRKNSAFYWKSYSDNCIVGGMGFDRKRRGETPPHTGRSRGHGRDARATQGKPASRGRFEGQRGLENMCFCETTPFYSCDIFGVSD
jgi:hypothetical protein